MDDALRQLFSPSTPSTNQTLIINIPAFLNGGVQRRWAFVYVEFTPKDLLGDLQKRVKSIHVDILHPESKMIFQLSSQISSQFCYLAVNLMK